ncbi:isochorismate synthase MenF [Bacillus sp. 03113]|uniref:isochorismate synthase n=1 Tax=Bacillus sp. 03113 TaxID=2578211 RepID=UPI00215B9C64|nr:isochorismate synthase [Bacillus sp. 03113]
MVAIQDAELMEGILDAIEKAKAKSKPILVSEVCLLDHIDPLAFFAAGKEVGIEDRFFWKDPSNSMYLIGIGISKKVQSDQSSDRFFHVEREWNVDIENAIIQNQYNASGIGPVLFGGFSFDPLKNTSSIWSNFSHSELQIPKYMLSIINGETYLTTNIFCTEKDTSSLIEEIRMERSKLFQSIKKREYYDDNPLINRDEMNSAQWKNEVRQLIEEIKRGPLQKVVIARELRLTFSHSIQIEAVLKRLIKEQQSSFIFAFEANGECFIGASPERLVKSEGKTVYSACLAGSAPRGYEKEEDHKLAMDLLNDKKNRLEHQYVVDMISEAMNEVCEEVIIPSKPNLLKIRDIQHLYTPVKGIMKTGQSILLLVERLHPTPALGGFPRELALEKIRESEGFDRGLYSGPLGWVDYQGNGEFSVSIRSGLVQGKEASIFAGCGIVADSDPEHEYHETNIKFRTMLTALGGTF